MLVLWKLALVDVDVAVVQALPFGGVKHSGFDRFAGIEGLRGCCLVKSVTEDRWPFIRTVIPKLLQVLNLTFKRSPFPVAYTLNSSFSLKNWVVAESLLLFLEMQQKCIFMTRSPSLWHSCNYHFWCSIQLQTMPLSFRVPSFECSMVLMFGPRSMGLERFSKPSLLQTRRHLSRNKHRMQLSIIETMQHADSG